MNELITLIDTVLGVIVDAVDKSRENLGIYLSLATVIIVMAVATFYLLKAKTKLKYLAVGTTNLVGISFLFLILLTEGMSKSW